MSAQEPSGRPLDSVNVVDASLFLKNHSYTLFGFPFSDVQIDGTAPAVPNGQILYAGGPLQSYLNIEQSYPLYDVVRSFGATGVFTADRRRIELFGGMGGVYVPFRSSYTMPNAWLTQVSAGARIALDPGQHLWLGGTASWLTDFADKNRQWGSLSADFTFRTGR